MRPDNAGNPAGHDRPDIAKGIIDQLTAVEESLYQTKNQSRQDPLNFPIRLTNKLAYVKNLADIGDFRPTAQSYAVRDEIAGLVDEELERYYQVMNEALPRFNEMVRNSQVDLIVPPVRADKP